MTLHDYDNQFDALGEKVPEERLVRKMLRSLPKKFDMKVTALEEAKDISEMKLDELVGSLQTFVATNERMDKKTKSIAFVSNAEEEDQQKTSEKPRSDEKAIQRKGVQCHECEGYGHIRTECATFLKKQKKGLTVSWSDDYSEGEAETVKFINALTGVCTSDTESCDEVLTYDELTESYKELCLKSEEVCRISEKQKETISKLQTERIVNLTKISEVSDKCEEGLRTIEEHKAIIVNLETDKLEKLAEVSKLNEEVTELNSHLENLKKHVVM
ncbi:gag-protease polyprotein [Trifolium pratense]|uniref:Gag-protease polyprotein n=1 Tax=Trifolium pratense TaxID=57577 RepID=A0A2K3M2K7_TRIPR|nr:gag-protease polyprotein [Trifolium pratense]